SPMMVKNTTSTVTEPRSVPALVPCLVRCFVRCFGPCFVRCAAGPLMSAPCHERVERRHRGSGDANRAEADEPQVHLAGHADQNLSAAGAEPDHLRRRA